jgi:hypothetical protein
MSELVGEQISIRGAPREVSNTLTHVYSTHGTADARLHEMGHAMSSSGFQPFTDDPWSPPARSAPKDDTLVVQCHHKLPQFLPH